MKFDLWIPQLFYDVIGRVIPGSLLLMSNVVFFLHSRNM